jgi:hypothetical protein
LGDTRGRREFHLQKAEEEVSGFRKEEVMEMGSKKEIWGIGSQREI